MSSITQQPLLFHILTSSDPDPTTAPFLNFIL
jgi:hypothetical protein